MNLSSAFVVLAFAIAALIWSQRRRVHQLRWGSLEVKFDPAEQTTHTADVTNEHIAVVDDEVPS